MIGVTDLARSARTGDAASLGLIFERLRPRLLARAFRILGYGAEVDDAIHDAFLIALRKIDSLADPDALPAWLDAIVANVCRGYRRNARRIPLDPRAGGRERVEVLQDPEARLERLTMKDWVWKALARLPETLRVAVLLRHFGNYSSYDEISEELAIPVGTVRSRLAEARRRLAEDLLSLSKEPEPEEQRSRSAWNRFYRDAMTMANEGRREEFIEHFRTDMTFISGRKVFRGRAKLELEVDGDIESGTLSHPMRILSSGNITVIDCKVTNPPQNPSRCPAGYALVVCRSADRSHRAYLYPGQRAPLPPDWS